MKIRVLFVDGTSIDVPWLEWAMDDEFHTLDFSTLDHNGTKIIRASFQLVQVRGVMEVAE